MTQQNNSVTVQRVRKRGGQATQEFDRTKIVEAVRAAWATSSSSVDEGKILEVVNTVISSLAGDEVDVEVVQDAVEAALLKHQAFGVAKAFILYRNKRAEARDLRAKAIDPKGIADYIHASKYARYIPELKRREVFEETVARSEAMHIKKFPALAEDIHRAFDAVRAKEVLPSMRGLQFGGDAITANNSRLFNCSYTIIDRLEAFSESLFLLLAGCGVGYSVQFDHVEKLPVVSYIDYKKVVHHVVEDSSEGWAESLRALLSSYYVSGKNIEFSYYKIRPEGSPLKTSGGRAPGHLKLKDSLEKIRGILDAAQGRKLRPIECHRIMCHSADAVLSGGIRRSAMICLFSLEDSEMIYSKTGKWYEKDPWFANANNSVILKRDDVKKKQFKRIFQMVKQWGEPGFYFTDSYEYGANPCFHPDTRIWTSNGYEKIIDLYNSGKENIVVADNRVGKGDTLTRDLGVSKKQATKVFLTQKNAEVFELVTEHGYKVVTTSSHEFPTPNGRKKLSELSAGDNLYLPSSAGEFGTAGTFDEGLLLGLYVGDGTTSHKDKSSYIDIWQNDFDSLDYVIKALNYSSNSKYSWNDCSDSEGGVAKKRAGGAAFYKWLSAIADDGEVRSLKERVPSYMYSASKEFVAGYINGLTCSDGTVLLGGNGSKATLSVRICQSNKYLLENIQVLLSMFGIVSRIYSRMPAGYRSMPDGRGGRKDYLCKESFELIINRPNSVVFRDNIGINGWKGTLLSKYLIDRGEECRKPERFITTVASITSSGKSDVYCLTQPETNVVTANGIVTGQCVEIGLDPNLTITEAIKNKLALEGITVNVGQTFTGWAFCNLTEMNAAKFKTVEDFEKAAWAATLIGTLQASYTNMPYLGWVSEEIAKRDSLLGVGMTGMMDSPEISCNPEYQASVARKVKDWNKEFAEKIGINPAARTTCVKPAGSTSLALGCVGSGHHAHHARRYIRRVTADEIDPLFQAFKAVNPHMCIRKPDGKWVIEFPVETPPNAILKDDLTALQFLEMVKSTQQHWVVEGTADESNSPGLRHNVSNTVTVKPDEWESVSEYIWANRNYFTGVSLLASTGDKDYAFAPNEAITTELDELRWNAILSGYKPLDYTTIVEDNDSTNLSGEVACAGGLCSIV